jgi:serine acetyltransferase/glycosyltransferase involved in cell wall biosynthesis
MNPSPIPRVSVVIPTYERAERVARLVSDLAAQTLPPGAFEVIVVDDGSREDPRPRLEAVKAPFHLVIERQQNQGPAAARHRGALLARGEILVFLDDDMIPAPGLLEEHLRVHDATPRAVVVGSIRASRQLARLSIFERFHARKLDQHTDSLRATGRAPRGTEVCSGNLSVRRAEYFAVDGFDVSLGRSEDRELGLKLEEAGAALRFADAASTVHDSDHTDLAGWLRRAFLYGQFELRIARKHPGALHANPWHYLDLVRWLPRPAYALAVVAPGAGRAVARAMMRLAGGLDALGLERPAIAGAELAYGMEYYRGVRAEAGSAAACARDLRRFRAQGRAARRGGIKTSRRRAAFARFVSAVRADHAVLQRYDARYDKRGREPGSLAHDFVERIGFQMMTAWRLMQLLKDAGSPLGAKIASRVIRLIYGADIHWDASVAEGVSLNHGMGLAVSHAARIARGTILSHNVSIGDGIDPETRAVGAPTIEEDVHIGPGAMLFGPITIGARSKIMAGAVVTRSVPPDSVVETPAPRTRARAPRPVASAAPKAVASPAPTSATPLGAR